MRLGNIQKQKSREERRERNDVRKELCGKGNIGGKRRNNGNKEK